MTAHNTDKSVSARASPLRGNQNARKHGWWSRQCPLTDQQLKRTVATLVLNGQYRRLRELARAVAYARNDKELARQLRQLATALQRHQVTTAAHILRHGWIPEDEQEGQA
ncbi:hypothetical protein HRbin28_02746 [bacterium HR28]|nr:hypothetical protein HRbin28_02746 [bacterium HR28]